MSGVTTGSALGAERDSGLARTMALLSEQAALALAPPTSAQRAERLRAAEKEQAAQREEEKLKAAGTSGAEAKIRERQQRRRRSSIMRQFQGLEDEAKQEDHT